MSHAPEFMPEFNSEAEYNAFFKREVDICAKHRNKDGEIQIESKEELYDMLQELIPNSSIKEMGEVNLDNDESGFILTARF